MMWIETVMHMSGTRANGEKYPPGFTPFEVEDWEGSHLVRGGIAREVPAPDWAAARPQEPRPAAGRDWGRSRDPEPSPPAPEPPAAAQAPDGPQAAPPAPADPKQAWVDYAVTRGMDADEASRMTKADLQSRFGPRM